MKSLIVEDDFSDRVILQEFPKSNGPVHVATSGREAVQAIREARTAGDAYDLVCLDIKVPELDGLEALRQIRALEEAGQAVGSDRATVVMTTALYELKRVTKAYRELCDAHLVKPIQRNTLLNQVNALGLFS